MAASLFGKSIPNQILGLSKDHPVEDCYFLKLRNSGATTGFYWALSPCFPKPLRVFCDMTSGATYATVPDNDGIISIEGAVNSCAGTEECESLFRQYANSFA